jgi:hypothetical protein
MTYASILKAELGWKVVLVNREGSPSIVDVSKWGIRYGSNREMDPLDGEGRSFSDRNNFVTILDPNLSPVASDRIKGMCWQRAKTLGWVKDEVRP